jgi:phosphatidylglycerophosphate synthase
MALTMELHARDALRLPGIISLARVALAVAFPFALGRVSVAVALLAGAAASDVLDGWVARRRHEETATGAILDAAADKIFVLSVVLGLVLRGRLGALDVVLLSTREIIEAPLLLWEVTHRARTEGERRALPLGKITTTLQFVALLFVLLRIPHLVPMLGAAATGVAAGLTYAVRERAAEHRRAPP